ncbi:MAG: formate dehydrogenase subunit delta [Burkholderiaceae bacterium]|nr:formate dehydrogenase subunit delta [Burkholderiaceae bacterium]MCX8005041.1 formate dehydrogenase subunit delta [Burkholderiaceae bacterium]
MDVDNLVRMANRIADFFAALPDREEARDGVATHLQRFWEPRMRAALLRHRDAGGAGLAPLVVEAIDKHRAALAPAPAA